MGVEVRIAKEISVNLIKHSVSFLFNIPILSRKQHSNLDTSTQIGCVPQGKLIPSPTNCELGPTGLRVIQSSSLQLIGSEIGTNSLRVSETSDEKLLSGRESQKNHSLFF